MFWGQRYPGMFILPQGAGVSNLKPARSGVILLAVVVVVVVVVVIVLRCACQCLPQPAEICECKLLALFLIFLKFEIVVFVWDVSMFFTGW